MFKVLTKNMVFAQELLKVTLNYILTFSHDTEKSITFSSKYKNEQEK